MDFSFEGSGSKVRWYRRTAMTNSFLDYGTPLERQFVSLQSWWHSRGSWDGAVGCLDPSVEASGAPEPVPLPASPPLPWPAELKPVSGAMRWSRGLARPAPALCRGLLWVWVPRSEPAWSCAAVGGWQRLCWPGAAHPLPSPDQCSASCRHSAGSCCLAGAEPWHLSTLP